MTEPTPLRSVEEKGSARKGRSPSSYVIVIIIVSIILAAFLGLWARGLVEVFLWGWKLIAW